MKVKVFQPNSNGKIEFTRSELEKLLNEIYSDGYNEGRYHHQPTWTWASPSISSYPTYSTATNSTTTKTNACSTDGINSLTCSDKTQTATSASAPTYTVRFKNGSDIKLTQECINSIVKNTSAVGDAFSALAREVGGV